MPLPLFARDDTEEEKPPTLAETFLTLGVEASAAREAAKPHKPIDPELRNRIMEMAKEYQNQLIVTSPVRTRDSYCPRGHLLKKGGFCQRCR